MVVQERIPATADIRTPFWGGIGTNVKHAEGWEHALGMAGLDFDVLATQLNRQDDGQPIPDRVANVRSDNGGYLGTVGLSYRPMPNRDLGGPVDALIEEGLGKLVHLSGPRGGALLLAAVELGPQIVLDLPVDEAGTKDVLQPHVLISSSHDGTRAMRGQLIVMRLVCTNGLTMPVSARQFTIRHTGDVGQKQSEAHTIYARWLQFHESLAMRIHQLGRQKLSQRKQEEFITRLFPSKEEDNVPAQTQAKRDDLLAILRNAPDLQATAGTGWAVYNAVVQYADHGIEYRSRGYNTPEENRALATLDGPGLALKDRAFNLLVNAN